jgi:hypothetical protein
MVRSTGKAPTISMCGYSRRRSDQEGGAEVGHGAEAAEACRRSRRHRGSVHILQVVGGQAVGLRCDDAQVPIL